MQAGRAITSDFFSHENSIFPPALTKNGLMYHGTKHEILDCITPDGQNVSRPQTTAAIIEGSVMVQLNRPKNYLNFLEYCDNIIIPYISTYLRNHNRVDVVYYIYKKYSLKPATRDKRGTGIRRPVNLTTKIPNNWASFLRVDMTKKSI